MTTEIMQCIRCDKPDKPDDDGEVWLSYYGSPEVLCPDCMTKGEALQVKRYVARRKAGTRRFIEIGGDTPEPSGNLTEGAEPAAAQPHPGAPPARSRR